MKTISAKKLRNKDDLKTIPGDNPGWYRWWAPEKSLRMLLNSSQLSKKYYKEIEPFLETKNIARKKHYYIYVGIAVKESLRARLNWHVNQKHSRSSVESGFLSTFRQSISSLIAGDQRDERATNDFIDTLYIEYEPISFPTKSNEAKVQIEKIEKDEIEKFVLPLNIKDNKQSSLKEFKKELRKCRKKAKTKTDL